MRADGTLGVCGTPAQQSAAEKESLTFSKQEFELARILVVSPAP